ncbi:MAG: hypothetical protein K2Y37_05155 [Pirellulales bacterium]|nr:hypothetical protein [Pirellulales bacterium]
MITSLDPHWQWTREHPLTGYCVEWAAPELFILSRRNSLYSTPSLDRPPRRLATLPTAGWKALASRVRPLQRLLRYSFSNVVRLPDERLFFTFDRAVGTFENGGFRPLPGLVRPTRVLRGACVLDADGTLYFGEYVGNPERHEIHVYRLSPGASQVEIVHTFPAGQVRHVHGIYRDPVDGSLWCVAGDLKPECRILRTRDQFASLETIGSGDETWRCVSLLFDAAGAYYGSDAEFIQNRLYFIDRTTLARTQLCAIDGPVYYSHALGSDLFFGVTAELCPSQQGRHGSLWHVRRGASPQTVLQIPKDPLPVRYFLPGTWQFPQGPGLADRLLVHLVALRGDNQTYSLRTRAD